MGHHHSHDGIDWDAKLRRLRESDEFAEPETRELAGKLLRPGDHSVIDVGSGAGGAAAAFAAELGGGGSVTVVDSAPELLAAAAEHVREVAPEVRVHQVNADVSSDELSGAAPADLVFASYSVHHLPDQLDGLRRLVALVKPGGRLAVVESGLARRVLPWDVGVGAPGLEGRLAAARDEWFREMRAGMEGSVRLPMGWGQALAEVGLTDVRSWSYLIERQPPLSDVAMRAVVSRLEWLRNDAEDRAAAEDVDAIDQLLDPASSHFVGNRSDVYVLGADTVHIGSRP